MSNSWKQQAKLQQVEYLENLKSFLSINSIEDMTTAMEGKPFGEGVAKALEFLLAQAEVDGFRTKNLEGYAGYIEYGEGEEEVGVLVHVDVVTVGDGWISPPFSPTIRDGKIYARGAIDDKGPGLAAYYALKMVRDSGLPLSKRIRFIIGTDEESGWLCMKRYGELEQLPEIGFSPDSSFPMVHAEKGQINPTLALDDTLLFEVDTIGNLWELTSLVAGDQGNSVPELAKAVVTLSEQIDRESQMAKVTEEFTRFLVENGVVGQVERESTALVFHVKGKPAHGMEPHEGINAGTMLAKFLYSYPFGGKDKAFLHLLAEVLHEDHFGVHFDLDCEDEVTGKLTVNVGILRYDQTYGATVRLNIRYPATVSVEERVQVFKAAVAKLGWSITNLRTSKAHYVPKDHPSIQILSRIYEEHTGEPAHLLSSGGATYARSLQAGIAYGPLFPGRESTAHQANEYADIDDLIKAMGIYAQAMYELAK